MEDTDIPILGPSDSTDGPFGPYMSRSESVSGWADRPTGQQALGKRNEHRTLTTVRIVDTAVVVVHVVICTIMRATVCVVGTPAAIVVMFRVVIIISGICLGIAKGVVGVRRGRGGGVHAFLAPRVRPARHVRTRKLESSTPSSSLRGTGENWARSGGRGEMTQSTGRTAAANEPSGACFSRYIFKSESQQSYG